MRIGVVTLFPELVENALAYGVVGRALQAGFFKLLLENPRNWASDNHRTVDDRPFGGGPGMVMKPEPLRAAIHACANRIGQSVPVVYLSPQGQLFDQALAREWSNWPGMVLVAGRYEGIDERVVRKDIDYEVSLGDFVLSGGEFAALSVVDAVVRLIPGVLGDPESSMQDSFGDDGLLDHPHYTRPESCDEQRVPDVLISGDHQAIRIWRREQSLLRTLQRRPELLKTADLSPDDLNFLKRHGYPSQCTGIAGK